MCHTYATTMGGGGKHEYEIFNPPEAEKASVLEPCDLSANTKIHETLKLYKGQISKHYLSKRWDNAKKLTNMYEMVYSGANASGCGGASNANLGKGWPPIQASHNFAKHVPVSRSFFKLWEMLHDHPEITSPSAGAEGSMTALFLAEGPGGFVEAFCKFRCMSATASHEPDRIHCITLLSADRSVPRWRIPTAEMTAAGVNVNIIHGPDGSGDIYKWDVILDVLKGIGGPNTADLVTADGGFDFSCNFDLQEEASLVLVAAEVLVAMLAQKQGGTFIVKMFDISTIESVALLTILRRSYSVMSINKPMTSRQANSEKYVICRGFLGTSAEDLVLLGKCLSTRNIEHLRNVKVKGSMLSQVTFCNSQMVSRQIGNIAKTLALLNVNHNEPHHRQCQRQQEHLAAAWCARYKV